MLQATRCVLLGVLLADTAAWAWREVNLTSQWWNASGMVLCTLYPQPLNGLTFWGTFVLHPPSGHFWYPTSLFGWHCRLGMKRGESNLPVMVFRHSCVKWCVLVLFMQTLKGAEFHPKNLPRPNSGVGGRFFGWKRVPFRVYVQKCTRTTTLHMFWDKTWFI